MSVVYDAGALIAAERSDREVWADHRVRLELGLVPVTTAPVVAQVSRSGRQAQLRRFLRGCEVASFGSDEAHDVGALAGRTKVADVVDVLLKDDEGRLKAHYVLCSYYGRWRAGEPMPASDCADARFVPIAEIDSYKLTPGTSAVIALAWRLLNGGD